LLQKKITMLLLLLLIPVNSSFAFSILDVSNTKGLAVTRINNISLITDEDTIIHYVNISSLTIMINNINSNLKQVPINFNTENFRKDIQLTLQMTKEKLKMITVNKNSLIGHARSKRGLINGLGTAIKWVTGNLDTTDKEKIDSTLAQLENNQKFLMKQTKGSFKNNRYLTDKFDKDMLVIKNNTEVINNKLREDTDAVSQVIILNQLSLQLLNLKEKIEQLLLSLELCKIGIPHHSVLDMENIENANYVLELSKITCHTSEQLLTYFLHVPKSNNSCITYCVLSVPFEYENKIYQTKVDNDLVLVNEEKVFKPEECQEANNKLYCKYIHIIENNCINQLVQHNGNYCSTYPSIKTKSFVKLNEQCSSIAGFKIPNITLNRGVSSLPKSFVITLNMYDEIVLAGKIHGVSTEAFPIEFKTNTVVNNSKTLNFETLELATVAPNVNFIESWQTLDEDNMYYVNVMMLIVLILGISIVMYSKCKRPSPTPVMIPQFQQIPLIPIGN
jgi:hypothetical protein